MTRNRVNIDLRQALGFGGIANFVRNLSCNLPTTENIVFTGCTYLTRQNDSYKYEWFPGVIKRTILPSKYFFNSRFKLPFTYEKWMRSKSDFNIFLSYALPAVRFEAPLVSTIHDIILLRAKSESSAVIDEHKRILNRTIERSKYILTVSQNSKRDLIDYFGLNEKVIHVIPNGIDQQAFRRCITNTEETLVREKYRLPPKYILNFGIYRNHKNIERLIEAYSKLPHYIRNDYKLVLTKSHPAIDDAIIRYAIGDDVRIIGYVDEVDKPVIYKLASVVYYASLYEGFGVPVIEAQAAGVPVVTSNISSLPEVAGEGAVLVNPYNTIEIKNAIERLCEDNVYRSQIVDCGLINSQQYTWDYASRKFFQFIHQII